jgi:serine phosphatase RsbU (regulator of sigma subunit)
VRQLFLSLAGIGPLILILEDLQWADPSSVELLSSLLPAISISPILLCLISRPDRDMPGWKLSTTGRELMGGRFTEIILDPLSEADGNLLISNLLGSDVLPDALTAMILSRAEGNPFYIEEVLRMLIDRGTIEQINGKWLQHRGTERTEIPDSLRGLLLARTDNLSDEEIRTLRVASVIGRQFTISILAKVIGSEASEIQLMSQLGALESSGLIRIYKVAPELSYIFQSALIQETAYDSLLEADRKKLHHAVGKALEELYSNERDASELAPMLGHHFFNAGDYNRALKYYTLAGDMALASYANQEAENHYRIALKLTESDSERAPLLYGLGMALRGQSRSEECIQVWREAIDIYRKMGPEYSEDVARLYARAARAAWEGGNTPESLNLCKVGLEEVAGSADSSGLALLVHEAARAYLFNGFGREAKSLCQEALDMARRLEIADVQADTLATMGLLPELSPAESTDLLTEAVQVAESAGLLSHAARAHNNLAALYANRIQDLQSAREHYRRSAEIRRLKGSKAGELLGLGGAAEISILLGDLEEAQSSLQLQRQLIDEIIDPGPAVFHFRKIEALLMRYQGDIDEAARRLRTLQAEERQRGNLQNLIEVNCLLTEISLEAYELSKDKGGYSWDEAEKSINEAISISEGGIGDKDWPIYLLSIIHVQQGNYKDAHHLQDQALENINRISTPINQGWLSLAQAKLATAEKNWDRALAAYDKSVGVFKKLRLRWLRARILAAWADMYAIRGEPADSERAQALLREALAAFDEMGVTFYAEIVKDKLQNLEAKSYSQALAHQIVAQEMAQAGKLQEDFLPGKPPELTGWELTVKLEPARETSGDFYDFIQLPDNRWGFVVADVADKGAGAALYMTMTRTLLRTFAGEFPDEPERVLNTVNQRILADTPASLFVTAFYGVIDPLSGSLLYCNAGHNPPYHLSPHSDDRVKVLTRTGLPLGIFEDKAWERRSIKLEPGDVLVLYTDGVTDAQNPQGEFYDKEKLLACALSRLGRSAREMQDTLLTDINDHTSGAQRGDDLTLMILRRKNAP